MLNSVKDWILGVNSFPARWFCGDWSKAHGWTHIVSDILVWAAYMTIPIVLIYFIRKRRDLPFPKIFWLFGAFIAACGTVHLVEAIIYWVPIYRISAAVKAMTAVVSWMTIMALFRVMPVAMSLRSPVALQKEIDARKTAESDLLKQTKALTDLNQDLQEKQLEYERQNRELETMNSLMINREVRMGELKKTIKELKAKLGQDPLSS